MIIKRPAVHRYAGEGGIPVDRGDGWVVQRAVEPSNQLLADLVESAIVTGYAGPLSIPRYDPARNPQSKTTVLATAKGKLEQGQWHTTLVSEHHRGGLLTHASVLSLTSDGFRQRPVHRGKWILEAVYGISPPLPPPNVGSIPTPVEGEQKKTIPAKLESHRTNASCAACHAKIDPLGFAFDNFDAIGRWRSVEDSQVGTGDAPLLDASGVLADGRPFAGPDEFKRLVAADLDRFQNSTSSKHDMNCRTTMKSPK